MQAHQILGLLNFTIAPLPAQGAAAGRHPGHVLLPQDVLLAAGTPPCEDPKPVLRQRQSHGRGGAAAHVELWGVHQGRRAGRGRQ